MEERKVIKKCFLSLSTGTGKWGGAAMSAVLTFLIYFETQALKSLIEQIFPIKAANQEVRLVFSCSQHITLKI